MRHFLFLLFPLFALGQGATNDYIFSQKPATGPLVVRPVTPTVGRLLGWPTSINTPAAITLGTGLSLAGSTLNATASSAWADLTGTPTTLTGYGITDALAATTAASTYQPLDADLTSIAALTTTNTGRTVLTAPGSTGTGNIVYAASPTFVSKLTTPEIQASALTGNLLILNQSGTTAMTISGSGSTTNVAFSSATASTIAHFAGGKILASLPLDTYPSLTELSYVKGVTSAIQTQLTATTNASNITSGSLALARIEQAGATSGQAIAWNGTAWAPATISSGATLAGNTFTGLQQFSGTGHAGLRLNNLTTAERDALSSPAAGMAIWNTTDGRLQLHNGSAWTSGMVRLSGDTMTGGLTISSTTSLLLGTAGSAVGNIGFRNATSGTATLEPPTGALGTYTVTLPGVASTLATLGANTFTGLQTSPGLSVSSGSFVSTGISSNSGVTLEFGLSGFMLGMFSTEVYMPSNVTLNWTNATKSSGFHAGTRDLILGRAAAASLQLGANTATASATAIGQTIKGPNATGTTSTGGSLTIAGGTGTSAGGAVIISTAATTTQAAAVTVNKDGVTTFAKPPVLPVYTVATLPATAAAGMVQGAQAVVTDAQNSNHHSAVTGGGSTVICVFYDGTNWKSH